MRIVALMERRAVLVIKSKAGARSNGSGWRVGTLMLVLIFCGALVGNGKIGRYSPSKPECSG